MSLADLVVVGRAVSDQMPCKVNFAMEPPPKPARFHRHPRSNRMILDTQMKADRILQAALALMLIAFCGALYTQLHQTIVNAGDTAPDFTITTDSGKTVTVHDFGGKL